MIKVRLPDGMAKEFKNANHVEQNAHFAVLYNDEKKSVWIAIVYSTGLVIENNIIEKEISLVQTNIN